MALRSDTAIRKVDKREDFYIVTGHSRGKIVSAKVHATYVEPRYGGTEWYALSRAVEMIRDHEGD